MIHDPISHARREANQRNRFYIWPATEPTISPFEPAELIPNVPETDTRYFAKILQQLDALLPSAGLTFVLTWHVNLFDPVMNDAVVILVGDEQNRIPAYRDSVRMIFKTGGAEPNWIGDTLRLPFSIAWRVLARELRNAAVRRGSSKKNGATIYPIPLGYFALQDREIVPMAERPVDVFFAGRLNVAGFSIRPSVAARIQMRAGLEAAQKALPGYRIVSSLELLGHSQKLGPMEYTQAMANARIALAPRGNFDETFRLFEAARMGCVIVSEPLPARWYYANCPVVQIRAWAELPDILRKLLKDATRLADLSERTMAWWDTALSEAAVARYVGQKLSATLAPH